MLKENGNEGDWGDEDRMGHEEVLDLDLDISGAETERFSPQFNWVPPSCVLESESYITWRMDKRFETVIFTRVWPVSAWGALTPPRQTQTLLRKLKREPSNNTSNFLSIIAHRLSQVEAAKIHAKERIEISKNTPPVESLIFFEGKCKNKVKVENCMYFFWTEKSP